MDDAPGKTAPPPPLSAEPPGCETRTVEDVLALWQLVFPLVLGGGAIAAWRISKRNAAGPTATGSTSWRDDSLDDWRKERDANAEAHRTERAANPEEATGRGDEQSQEKRHQRIGG
jgi:hypothetical protein